MHFEFYTNSIWCLINHPLKQSTVCVREREREREMRDAGTRPPPQTLTLGWGDGGSLDRRKERDGESVLGGGGWGRSWAPSWKV